MRIVRDLLFNLVLISLALLLTATVVAIAEEKADRVTLNTPVDLKTLSPEERAQYEKYVNEITELKQRMDIESIKTRVKAYFRYLIKEFRGKKLWKTLKTIGLSFAVLTMTTLLIFAFGLYWGLKAGYKGGFWDRVLSALAPLFSGIPAWFWALLFVWTLWWKWDIGDISYTNSLMRAKAYGGAGIMAYLNALLLPVIALTLSNVVVYAFNVRNLVKREAFEEYFFIDGLKGLPERRIMRKLLRTVLPSFLTFTSYNFLNLMMSAMAVEKLFEVPGIGKVLADSVEVIYLPNEFGEPKIPHLHFDGFSIFFVAFVMAAFYFLNSTVLEALYLYLDPRREIND